jgi:hypothetical protein
MLGALDGAEEALAFSAAALRSAFRQFRPTSDEVHRMQRVLCPPPS